MKAKFLLLFAVCLFNLNANAIPLPRNTDDGQDSVDFRMKDLHGKWLTEYSKDGNSSMECLQSTMSWQKYGKPYFCSTVNKKLQKAMIMFYLPDDIYFEKGNSYTTIKIQYTILDGTTETRTYIVQKMVNRGNNNIVSFVALEHILDFKYYAPIAKSFDIFYINSNKQKSTFTINNPGFDNSGNLETN